MRKFALAALVAALVPLRANATVTSAPPPITYTCNGVATAYSVTFPYLSKSDLSVKQTTATGAVTTLAQPAGYTVSPSVAPTTGTITLAVACPSGSTLSISRSMQFIQPQGFRGGSYQGATHESAFDRLEMQIQSLSGTFASSTSSGLLSSTDWTRFNQTSFTAINQYQAPGTSTVAMTLGEKLRDVVSSRDTCGTTLPTDPTACLQQAFTNAIAAGGTVLRIVPGTYNLSAGVQIIGANKLTVLAYGVTLNYTGSVNTTRILEVRNSQDVQIEGLTITSTNAQIGTAVSYRRPSNADPGFTTRFNVLKNTTILGVNIGIEMGINGEGQVSENAVDNVDIQNCNTGILQDADTTETVAYRKIYTTGSVNGATYINLVRGSAIIEQHTTGGTGTGVVHLLIGPFKRLTLYVPHYEAKDVSQVLVRSTGAADVQVFAGVMSNITAGNLPLTTFFDLTTSGGIWNTYGTDLFSAADNPIALGSASGLVFNRRGGVWTHITVTGAVTTLPTNFTQTTSSTQILPDYSLPGGGGLKQTGGATFETCLWGNEADGTNACVLKLRKTFMEVEGVTLQPKTNGDELGNSAGGARWKVTATQVNATSQVAPGNGTVIGGNIWSGSGAPGAIGNNGDYYLRTDTPSTANQRIYIKIAGTWTGIL